MTVYGRDMRNTSRILTGLLMVLLAGGCAAPSPTATNQLAGTSVDMAAHQPAEVGTPTKHEMLRGVTVDTVDNLDAIVAAVDALPETPTVRIVFDPKNGPEYYAAAVAALKERAFLMGELLDSTGIASLNVDQVRARAEAYYAAFGDTIDIWEVGNELNGEWAGTGPAEINAKVTAAHRVISDHGGTTAITLNYWSSSDCYSQDWEKTIPYAETIPAQVREETDYLLLSAYETACKPPQHPTASQIAETLVALGKIFPNADLGIGEIGAQGTEDDLPKDPTLAEKKAIAEHWIGMNDTLKSRVGERFVGGWFWWYFCRDAVARPQNDTLLPTLIRLLAGL
ncbi:hypothetical protein HMPREF1531_00906 [Propionibacterium sp. oral taxon 192 str. F0372]|nr:hypothetical protein HMPREF1531_00906 [Propionibacterium sp. oral taxon 192 str. F0372]